LFEETHPDTRLQFVVKAEHGKGGIQDYLLNTAPVVPALLPDLVLIDIDELEEVVRAELLHPIGDLVPRELVDDLYPFARESGTFDGKLYGLQVLADLDHLVYNPGEIDLVPRAIPGVLNMQGQYLFPAGGQEGLVNDAFLTMYLAARNLPPEADLEEAFLEPGSLASTLQYYLDGKTRGIFPLDILGYHTTADCWPHYLDGSASMTQISAHRYLAERSELLGSAASEIPGSKGTIGRGWALALVAPDVGRQSVAVDFMVQMMAPQVNAEWNQAAAYLPTRAAALEYWDAADPYVLLMQQQLAIARPRPRLPNYEQVAGALQLAVEDVFEERSTPEEAAARVLDSTP
jgi:hypothetical protein